MLTLLTISVVCGLAIVCALTTILSLKSGVRQWVVVLSLVATNLLAWFSYSLWKDAESGLLAYRTPTEFPGYVLSDSGSTGEANYTLTVDKPSYLIALRSAPVLEFDLSNPSDYTLAYAVVPGAVSSSDSGAKLHSPLTPLQPIAVVDCPKESMPAGIGRVGSAGRESVPKLLPDKPTVFVLLPKTKVTQIQFWRESEYYPVLVLHWYSEPGETVGQKVASGNPHLSGTLSFTPRIFSVHWPLLVFSLGFAIMLFFAGKYVVLLFQEREFSRRLSGDQ